MPAGPAPRSAMEIELNKLATPRIFLVRMLVFLILCSLIVVVIHPQILTAFKANPPLNALIIGVLVIGILLAFRQVIRLFRERHPQALLTLHELTSVEQFHGLLEHKLDDLPKLHIPFLSASACCISCSLFDP